jgi:hypothetical protein
VSMAFILALCMGGDVGLASATKCTRHLATQVWSTPCCNGGDHGRRGAMASLRKTSALSCMCSWGSCGYDDLISCAWSNLQGMMSELERDTELSQSRDILLWMQCLTFIFRLRVAL